MTITEPTLTINRIIQGDAYARMLKLPDAIIDTTVTSPPYYMQRSYLPDGHPLRPFEMGQEPTVEKYVADLVDLFRAIYRLTKPRGTCWVNIADGVMTPELHKQGAAPGYQVGESLGIPWKFAEAMRLAGWYRCPEFIWSKPNPMVGKRKTAVVSHEYLFLFAKSKNYYFDPLAITDTIIRTRKGKRSPITREALEPDQVSETQRSPRSVWEIPVAGFAGRKLIADFKEDGEYLERDPGCPVHGDEHDGRISAGPLFGASDPDVPCSCARILDHHFAVMPFGMAERAILASTSEVGNCPTCGLPWIRMIESERTATRPGTSVVIDPAGRANRDPLRHVTMKRTVGWERSCACPLERPQPAKVLDPFCGAATTPTVAEACGRDWIAFELNPVNARKFGPSRIEAGYERNYKP